MPSEIAKYLYTDEEMRPVFSKMARSFNYSEVFIIVFTVVAKQKPDFF